MGRVQCVVDRFGHIESDFDVPTSTGLHLFPVAGMVRVDSICLGQPCHQDMRYADYPIDKQHRILALPRRDCSREAQPGASLVGWTTSRNYTNRSCGCNLTNALVLRHLAPMSGAVADLDLFPEVFRSVLADWRMEAHILYETYRSSWIERWPLAKRVEIAKSIKEDPVLSKRIKTFVKRECGPTRMTKARAIQFYFNLHSQAIFAPWMYSMQKSLTSLMYRRELFPGIFVTMGSGLNNVQLGEWMQEVVYAHPGGLFYERDGKNWDSSIDRKLLLEKIKLYSLVYRGWDFLQQVFDTVDVQGTFVVPNQGVGVYQSKGTVKSGHNDTSLGNSIINIVITVLSMIELGLQGDIIVNGDDLLCLMSRDFDEHALAKLEATYGIVPEYKKFTNYLQVEFASSIWWEYDHGKFINTPKPGRLLAKLFWTVSPPGMRRLTDFAHAVAIGHMPICGGLPVIGIFLRSHLTSNPHVMKVRKIELCDVKVDYNRDCILEQFCTRYKLPPTAFADCEVFLQSLPHTPGFIQHPVLAQITQIDLAKLDDR